MLSQVIWSSWDGVPPIADLDLEAATIMASKIMQPLESVGLRVLYLVERVCCQLVGIDALRVLMDPP